MMAPFHLAIPVVDIEATRAFYVGVLGCRVGREAERWIDFDLAGHQVSAHLVDHVSEVARNEVDGDGIPVRHFGLVLPWDRWTGLGEELRARGVVFLLAPRIRFVGQVGEQGTFFLADPSGNAIEFKSFRDPSRLFSR